MSLLDDLVAVSKYIDPSLAPVANGLEKVVAAIVYHAEHGQNLVTVVKDAVEAGKADAQVIHEVQKLIAPPPKDSPPSAASPDVAAAGAAAPAPVPSSQPQAPVAAPVASASPPAAEAPADVLAAASEADLHAAAAAPASIAPADPLAAFSDGELQQEIQRRAIEKAQAQQTVVEPQPAAPPAPEVPQ